MKKIGLICFIVFLFFQGVQIKAFDLKKDTKIYVSGASIGLEVETGVMVVGTYGITVSGKILKPWQNSNICEGDVFVSYNEDKITNTKSLLEAIKKQGARKADITLNRKGNLINTSIEPVLKNDKTYSLGLYIKDELLGVGTLTYIIPSVNYFGSLGHTICNTETYGGKIYEASVDGIIKSGKNVAGEKRASIVGNAIGDISGNSISGVFGTINVNFDKSSCRLINFKTKEEVTTGKASILTVVDGKNIEEFEIEITDVEKQSSKDVKGIKFAVTDERLLAKTGGVIQGMSGSPIIQDDKIVGAVTHVIVNNPLTGYGIFLEFMFEDMDVYVVE